MKRIVAMLLALAAMVCCAGCKGKDIEETAAAPATTMTVEDFYIYSNGQVIISDMTKRDTHYLLKDTAETKRGIRNGSTLKELEQAYYGEPAEWTPWDVEFDEPGSTSVLDIRDIRIGQDTLEESGWLDLEGIEDMSGNFHMVDGVVDVKKMSKKFSVRLHIYIDFSPEDGGRVDSIYTHSIIL